MLEKKREGRDMHILRMSDIYCEQQSAFSTVKGKVT